MVAGCRVEGCRVWGVRASSLALSLRLNRIYIDR